MSKLKYILIFLIIALAAINTILYFAVVEMEEAVVSPPPIRMEEVAPPETIITGVCTFGDCPVATTAKNPATTSQNSGEPVSDIYTLKGSEPEEAPEPVEFPTEAPEEPVWKDDSRTVTCWVTAYCGCYECSGEFGAYTRFGTPCRANHTVAVDPDFISYWTQLEINGITYTAEDCGGDVNGWEIDIYFPEHWQTEAWKTGWYDVTIY